MVAGGGYDATLGALEGGAGQLTGQGNTLGGLGGRASSAAAGAAGGVNGGTLPDALTELAEELTRRSENLARVTDAASRSVQNCATSYRTSDQNAASALAGTGAPVTR